MINPNIFITCKESRIENNRSFYGCFNLGPFDSGQSLTVANALRRTLLSDSTGIGIVSVSIDNVSHEYSTIPGMRESVLDLILNLKEIVLKKQNNSTFYKKDSSIYNQISASYFKPVSGFLKVKGPGVIRAKDLKLPPFLNCVDPEQYIATLSEDGFLCIKCIIMEGKGYMLQTQNNTLFTSSNKQSKNQNSDDIVFSEKKNYVKKRLHFLKELNKSVSVSVPLLHTGVSGLTTDKGMEEQNTSFSSFPSGNDGKDGKDGKELKKGTEMNEKYLEEKMTFFDNKKPSFLKIDSNLRPNLQEGKDSFSFLPSPTGGKTGLTVNNVKKKTKEMKLKKNEKTSTIDMSTVGSYGTFGFRSSLWSAPTVPSYGPAGGGNRGNPTQNQKLAKQKGVGNNVYLNLDTVFNPITKVSYIIEDFDNKIVDDFNQKVTFINEVSALIESSVFLKKQFPFLTQDIDLWCLDSSLPTFKSEEMKAYLPMVKTESTTGDTSSPTLNQSDIYKFVDSCSIAEIKQLSHFLHPLKRKTAQHNIIIEIWTNGSVHPREALYEAFEKLSSAFLNMQKTQNYNPIYINESSLLLVESPTQTLQPSSSTKTK